jgi:hypothetical protein
MKYTSLILAMIGAYLLLVVQVSGTESTSILDQKTSIDSLIALYAEKRGTQITPFTAGGEEKLLDDDNLRLRSEVIDLRVERDRLASRVRMLESERKEILVVGAKSKCEPTPCISEQEVKADKIMIQAASAIRAHNIGINLRRNSDCPEAHKYAEAMINGAIEDLKLLGFDTTNVNEELELDTLMSQLEQIEEAQQR